MRKFVFALLLIAAPSVASAQLSDSAMSMLYDNTRSNMMNDTAPRAAPIIRPSPSILQNSGRVQAAALPYKSSAATRRQAQMEMIARLEKTNPDAAQTFRTEVARNDFAGVYRNLTAPFGLRADDVGDNLAAYTALGYLIINGAPDPSPKAVRALRNQIAPRLAANAQLNAPGTRAKLGEELKLLFVTLHAGWQSARREGNLASYSSGVARMFEQQGGDDLRRVRLTDAGLVRR